MKVILSGCTGFIGGEILAQCLAHPSITSVIALSRRDLPAHAKLTTVIMKDFADYPEDVLAQLEGAAACIWAIGTYKGSMLVDVDYPLAFANSMLKTLPDGTAPFKYVHLGGAFTELDQEKSLWFLQNGRRTRGLAEANMMAFEREHSSSWKSFIAKPGPVLRNGLGLLSWCLGTSLSIRVSELAAAMIETAVQGHDSQVMLNVALVTKGRALIQK